MNDSVIGRDKRVFACPAVARSGAACTLVLHHSNGDMVFLCGSNEHGTPGSEEEEPVYLHLSHLLEKDPSLKEIVDLPAGCEVERSSIDGAWIRRQIPSEEDD